MSTTIATDCVCLHGPPATAAVAVAVLCLAESVGTPHAQALQSSNAHDVGKSYGDTTRFVGHTKFTDGRSWGKFGAQYETR